MTSEQMIAEAISQRLNQGLSVETSGFSWAPADHKHVRHCVDAADRDAYIARCQVRGETIRVLPL